MTISNTLLVLAVLAWVTVGVHARLRARREFRSRVPRLWSPGRRRFHLARSFVVAAILGPVSLLIVRRVEVLDRRGTPHGVNAVLRER